MAALTKIYGWDYYRSLRKNNPVIVQAASQGVSVVAADDRAVLVEGNYYNTMRVKATGNPVNVIFPPERAELVLPPAGTAQQPLRPNPAAFAVRPRLDPSLPTWIGVCVLVGVLVGVPLWWLVTTSLRGEQGLTLAHYRQIFSDRALLRAVRNSVLIAFWASLLATAVGSLMGWLVTRTDLPLKQLFRALVLASFVTPPFVGAFAWTML